MFFSKKVFLFFLSDTVFYAFLKVLRGIFSRKVAFLIKMW